MSVHPTVQRAIDAANAGDTDGFLDTFTDQGTVDDWGRQFRGHAAIRGWSNAEFVGVDVSLTVTSVTSTGNTVTVSCSVGGDGFNGPSDFVFSLDGDRISLMRISG
jgi:hypothetical protein